MPPLFYEGSTDFVNIVFLHTKTKTRPKKLSPLLRAQINEITQKFHIHPSEPTRNHLQNFKPLITKLSRFFVGEPTKKSLTLKVPFHCTPQNHSESLCKIKKHVTARSCCSYSSGFTISYLNYPSQLIL